MIIQPTPENLERLKQTQDDITYWLTADFFPVNPELKDSLTKVYDQVMDVVFEEEIEDSAATFTIGRIVVKEARRLNMSPKDYNKQLSNFNRIVLVPICFWEQNESGNWNYTLSSSICR